MVAKYLYDVFGNCTISSDTTNTAVANANPIRYRGYYYDDDTGLYYCNARYYSPKWRRFISPDDTAYLDPDSVSGLNLYCYCNNDPVNYKDPTGKLLISSLFIAAMIGGAIAGAAINTASYLYTNEDPTLGGVLWAFAIGALVRGFGGAAGATTGWWSIGFMAAAGVTSGVYTGITTDGTIGQKNTYWSHSCCFCWCGSISRLTNLIQLLVFWIYTCRQCNLWNDNWRLSGNSQCGHSRLGRERVSDSRIHYVQCVFNSK